MVTKEWIIPRSEVTSGVQGKSAVVSESKADNSNAHTNKDWNDATSNFIFRISHGQNWNNQNKGSNDLVKAKIFLKFCTESKDKRIV